MVSNENNISTFQRLDLTDACLEGEYVSLTHWSNSTLLCCCFARATLQSIFIVWGWVFSSSDSKLTICQMKCYDLCRPYIFRWWNITKGCSRLSNLRSLQWQALFMKKKLKINCHNELWSWMFSLCPNAIHLENFPSNQSEWTNNFLDLICLGCFFFFFFFLPWHAEDGFQRQFIESKACLNINIVHYIRLEDYAPLQNDLNRKLAHLSNVRLLMKWLHQNRIQFTR